MMGTMTTPATKLHRVVQPGRAADGDVWVEIKWDGKRLSLSGVTGPKRNGNATGSAGQNLDDLHGILSFAEGWSPELVAQLHDIWQRWHLNDMKAGCEHQRAAGWDKRPIDPTKPLDSYGRHFAGQRQDSWNMLTWVRRDEHPDGLLNESCEVCGYRFGTAWRSEEVPAEVIDFLRGLPEPTKSYPWADR